jgi:hypothetical protein
MTHRWSFVASTVGLPCRSETRYPKPHTHGFIFGSPALISKPICCWLLMMIMYNIHVYTYIYIHTYIPCPTSIHHKVPCFPHIFATISPGLFVKLWQRVKHSDSHGPSVWGVSCLSPHCQCHGWGWRHAWHGKCLGGWTNPMGARDWPGWVMLGVQILASGTDYTFLSTLCQLVNLTLEPYPMFFVWYLNVSNRVSNPIVVSECIQCVIQFLSTSMCNL